MSRTQISGQDTTLRYIISILLLHIFIKHLISFCHLANVTELCHGPATSFSQVYPIQWRSSEMCWRSICSPRSDSGTCSCLAEDGYPACARSKDQHDYWSNNSYNQCKEISYAYFLKFSCFVRNLVDIN